MRKKYGVDSSGYAKELLPIFFLHLLHREPGISLTALSPFASGLADLDEALEAGLQKQYLQQHTARTGAGSRRTKADMQKYI